MYHGWTPEQVRRAEPAAVIARRREWCDYRGKLPASAVADLYDVDPSSVTHVWRLALAKGEVEPLKTSWNRPRINRPVTPVPDNAERNQRIISLRRQGYTRAAIAKELKIGLNVVCGVLHRSKGKTMTEPAYFVWARSMTGNITAQVVREIIPASLKPSIVWQARLSDQDRDLPLSKLMERYPCPSQD